MASYQSASSAAAASAAATAILSSVGRASGCSSMIAVAAADAALPSWDSSSQRGAHPSPPAEMMELSVWASRAASHSCSTIADASMKGSSSVGASALPQVVQAFSAS